MSAMFVVAYVCVLFTQGMTFLAGVGCVHMFVELLVLVCSKKASAWWLLAPVACFPLVIPPSLYLHCVIGGLGFSLYCFANAWLLGVRRES